MPERVTLIEQMSIVCGVYRTRQRVFSVQKNADEFETSPVEIPASIENWKFVPRVS